jgi:hypothetical protein
MPHRPLIVAALLLSGCQPGPPPDTDPPRLLDNMVSDSGAELELEFDEPLTQAAAGGDFTPQPPAAVVDGARVTVPLPANLKPGKGYKWTAEVTDTRNNLTSVAGRFYGPNAHPASLRLNEVRIAGSGAHTDMVELRAETSGNLGGWTLDAYSGPEARQRLVLPDREVEAGDLIVIHYRPTGNPAERDETEGSDTSGGSDTEPTAWDFWQPGGKGLSAVKGLIALRRAPTAAVADALLYSRQPGAGLPLAEAAGWVGRDELNPEACTATRTWSRTDSAPATWIVTANGGATPGKPNKLTPWAGPSASRKAAPKTKGRGPRRSVRGTGTQGAPGSRSGREPAEAPGPRRGSTDGVAAGPDEGHPATPGRRRPRGQVRRRPIPTCPSSAGRTVAARGSRREDGEEGPPLPGAPCFRPRQPGSGPASSPRREAARP